MEIFISAVLGEVATRSISFIINKYSKPPALAVEGSLQRALLRAQVIVDEAMGRRITNRAMLQHLNMLQDSMHRGYYTLDRFRCRHHHEEDAEDQAVSRSWSLSKVSYAKGLCFSRRGEQVLDQMRDALDNLSSLILGANELVLLLTSCPRIYRQPYSMHLLLGNCMFGRQLEAQLVINFLLHTKPPGDGKLEVLPIVGPILVGKSTLVGHVCKDERVCDHFSQILFLSDHDFTDDGIATFRKRCALKHQSRTSKSSKDGRLLIVVELAGDLNEDAWNRFYSTSSHCVSSNSKIIVTSQSDKIIKFGTTQVLTLKHPSNEEYWYYFKTLTFGSIDPKMHPRLAYLAMEIARTLSEPNHFLHANITTCLLRDNFDIQYWCKVLAFLRGLIQGHFSRFGEHPFNNDKIRPAYLGRMAVPSEIVVVSDQRQRSSKEEVPKIRLQDVMYGNVKLCGKFEILGWNSPIPPYYSYVGTCEIRELKATGAKRKRSMDKGVTLR